MTELDTASKAGPLARLTSQERWIAEIKALLIGPHTKAAFTELIRRVQILSPDRLKWNASNVQECLDSLRRKKVLETDYAMPFAYREALTLEVRARPGSAALFQAIRAALPSSPRERRRSSWDYTPPLDQDVDYARSLHLAVLQGDAAGVDALIKLVQPDDDTAVDPTALAAIFACAPAQPAFVAGLPQALRDRVAAAHVRALLDFGLFGDSVSALIAMVREEDWGRGSPRLDRALLRLDIMAERFAAARERIERLRAADPLLATTATASIAFLTGRNDEAMELFRAALKHHRKVTHKRKTVLPDEAGLLHVLALLAGGGTAALSEIEALLKALDDRDEPAPAAVTALAALADLVAGRDGRVNAGYAARLQTMRPLASAIVAVALAVVDGELATKRASQSAAAVQRWGAELTLPARVLAEVHARFSKDSIAWTNRLIRLGPGEVRRFLDIVPIRDLWERSLDRLTGLVGGRMPDSSPEPVSRAKRLAFLVDPETLEIGAHEQTAKAGGWTTGRTIALKRLQQHEVDYLTAADLPVIAAIRQSQVFHYGPMSYSFDAHGALPALVGHPSVFDARAPEKRVELVRYPAELVVRETAGGIHVALSHFSVEPAVFIDEETPTRWRIVELSKELAALGEVLTADGIAVPKDGRERVIALIKTQNPLLPIRSELAGVEGEAGPGDATPVLQIAPTEDGLSVGAVVRPAGADGPVCQPGAGARSVLATEGGAHRRVNRDLSAETAGLSAVIGACPALAEWRVGDHAWRVEGFEAGLEVLQELQSCLDPLKIEWPEGTPIRTTRNIGTKSVSLTISTAREWFEISGKVVVDEGAVLDMTELLGRLGQARGRFVPLDDGRFLALTDDLKRRLEGFAAVTEEAKGSRRIGAAGALAVEELVQAAGKVDAAKRWKDLLARIDAAQRFEPVLPPGFEAELRDYQMDGYVWLARLCQLGLGACLADDMGLGKTVQSIALLLAQAPKGASLVVAPTSVCHNWQIECARFAPGLRTHVLAATRERAALVESLGPGDVLIISYGLLHIEAALLAKRHWTIAIFDEAQNLKNTETRRAQASKQIEADFRLALSGTPVENRLDELWSLFDTVLPGLLGSREGFQRRFSAPIERLRSAPARQALKLLLRPFLLRRTKAAVLTELPPRTEIVVEVEPGEDERAFYEAVRRRALASLAEFSGDGGQKRIHILAEIMRLRRAACHPGLLDERSTIESAKLAGLMELVRELRANRHRALVFSQFTGHLDRVAEALEKAGVKALRLDGSTPAAERARLVQAFQGGEGELFLLSLKAGGTGLNLTGADYVLHLDPWWNPAVEDQATDRAHRIGQTRPVTVYRLITKGSIEEKIIELHAAKRDLAADFLDGTEAAARLSEDELMGLIRG
jgi:superfamily II DNA or RNA helicase